MTAEKKVMSEEDASDLLARAIREHARACGLVDDSHLLNTFGVIACWQPAEGDQMTFEYTVHFDRSSIAPHEMKGLFAQAVDEVANLEDEAYQGQDDDDGLDPVI